MVASTRRIAPDSHGTKASSLTTARVEHAAWCMPSPHAPELGTDHLAVPRDRTRLALELGALALIVVAHVVLLTRLLHARTFFDEGVYLLSLEELRHGAALGREVFTSQVPGFYVVLQAIGWIYGVSVERVRLGIVTIDAAGLVFAYLLARRLAGPLAGLLAGALIATAPTLPELGGRIYADGVAMAFVLASLWLAATRRGYAAGAVFAAAVLVKL